MAVIDRHFFNNEERILSSKNNIIYGKM